MKFFQSFIFILALPVFWAVLPSGFLALAQKAEEPPSNALLQHRRDKMQKQLELIQCEREIWDGPVYPEKVSWALSMCMEGAFSNRESFCRMDVEYYYDYIPPGEETRWSRHLNEFFFQRWNLLECFERPEGPSFNIDYRYDQLRALVLCMGADEFQSTIDDEESAEWLSSCMSHLSRSRTYLDSQYEYVKNELRKFQVHNTIDSVFEQLCMGGQAGGEDNNWCRRLSEGLKSWYSHPKAFFDEKKWGELLKILPSSPSAEGDSDSSSEGSSDENGDSPAAAEAAPSDSADASQNIQNKLYQKCIQDLGPEFNDWCSHYSNELAQSSSSTDI